MTNDETERYVFYCAPGVITGDPIKDKLLRSHEAKAASLGVEFTNYGWVIAENGICSKTTKGILDSNISPATMQVSHSWITYKEKARREEQQKREMLKSVGINVRDHPVQQLTPLRAVYGDLTEFAPIWEAIDKATVFDFDN
jgi:hypothetical protein